MEEIESLNPRENPGMKTEDAPQASMVGEVINNTPPSHPPQDVVCQPSVAKTMRHELVHLVASIILALILGSYFDNYFVGLWTFAVCMFLDGDHLFDYFSYLIKFNKPFSLKEFLSGSYFSEWKKFVTPLHSWELVLLLGILFFIIKNPFLIATSLALGVHYFVDYFTNDVNKKAYFILYRAAHGFKKAAIRNDFAG